ncbi:MAG: sigma-70 family RNA polymerase sigma factor [Bacteroidota bacterium]
MTEYSDSELLEKFRVAETQHFAFNLIVRKYQQRLYSHVRKMVTDHDDANDLLQNTFIKVWNNLGGFREDSQLFTWLYRIATNECLTFLKNKKKRYFLQATDVEGEMSARQDNSAPINSDQLLLKLQQAVESLPAKQKLVFNMRYFEQIKYEEMSKILGTSVGALKASYHHAVAKVEKYITGR